MSTQEKCFPVSILLLFSSRLTLLLSVVLSVSVPARATKSVQFEINNDGTSTTDTSAVLSSQQQQCTLYLAPSTIPGANLGMFTSIPMSPFQHFLGGDVAIPWIDVIQHAPNEFSHFEHYTWTGEALGMQRDTSDAFAPGLYAATNCWLPLINIDGTLPTYDTTLALTNNPAVSAGSMTPYHNASIWATANIPAGAELFIHYGDPWFIHRDALFGLIPLTKDYPIAEKLVTQFANLNIASIDGAQADLWKMIKNIPFQKSRIINAFPATLEEAMLVATDGMVGLHQPHHMHSLEYLQQHGACMDHIRPGSTTYGGRGAFATRALSGGQVITTAPLLHIPDREKLLNMYEKIYAWKDETWTWTPNKRKVVGEQILINFCFGHVESTLVLCPYSSGVGYINHNKENPNVKITWAQHGKLAHDDKYLTWNVQDFYGHHKVGLALNFVALRDINEGEELVMDYGDAWDTAWNDHVANFEEIDDEDTSQHQPAELWNTLMRNTPIRTQEEQMLDPYPKHIVIHCHSDLSDSGTWNDLAENDFVWKPGDFGIPCTVLARLVDDKNGRDVYNVELDDESHFTNIPRKAFLFVNAMYSTAMHSPNAFRFPMQIPEDMMPDQWRNLR